MFFLNLLSTFFISHNKVHPKDKYRTRHCYCKEINSIFHLFLFPLFLVQHYHMCILISVIAMHYTTTMINQLTV